MSNTNEGARMQGMSVTWLDFKLLGVRFVLWRGWGWGWPPSRSWRPRLVRDAYGAVGWRIFRCGPLWIEWSAHPIEYT